MQKLKNSILDKMLESHLTKAEVDFLLELSHYQDDTGKIYGVYYRDVCAAVGISYETFYATMESLVKKGFLHKEKASYGDFDLTILGNDFSYPGAVREGYISTGHYLFHDKNFKALKAGEKLLTMQILKISGASDKSGSGGKYYIAVEGFFAKYTRLMQITKRTLRTYLTRIKQFISVTLHSKFYLFKPKDICFLEKTDYIMPSDKDRLSDQLMRTACRRNRATYTQQQYKDTKNLIRQYLDALKTETARLFLSAVETSIKKANEPLAKRSWNRHLNPKFIHKLLLQR